jgi:hypothetical protein
MMDLLGQRRHERVGRFELLAHQTGRLAKCR